MALQDSIKRGFLNKGDRMRTKVLWSVVALLVAAGTVRAADANDVKAALAKRIKSLQNVVVVYDFRSEPNQRGLDERNRKTAGKSIEGAVTEERQCKLYCLDGKLRCETTEKPMPQPVMDGIPTTMPGWHTTSSTVEIHADGLSKTLFRYQNDTVFEGTIDTRVVQRGHMILEPIGIEAMSKPISVKTLASSRVTAMSKDGATLEFAARRGSLERWRLSAEYGYAPILQESVDANGFVWYRTQMSEWKKIGDIWVAYRAVGRGLRKAADGRATEGSENTFAITSCELESKDNVPALYEMNWPDGTAVRTRDRKRYQAQGGELRPVAAETTAVTDDSPGLNRAVIVGGDGSYIVEEVQIKPAKKESK
jgi:hypothetical protein